MLWVLCFLGVFAYWTVASYFTDDPVVAITYPLGWAMVLFCGFIVVAPFVQLLLKQF